MLHASHKPEDDISRSQNKHFSSKFLNTCYSESTSNDNIQELGVYMILEWLHKNMTI